MSNKISENCDSIESLKVAIVGGGLVGSLASIHLAQKGYDVHLYEFREDPRTAALVQGKSINLALSQRGRLALAQVGLEKEILAQSIPMRGRMLHDLNGNMTSVPYDPVNNQCLYSVGRKLLNEIILTAADKFENIHLNFNKKLVSAKLEDGQLSFVDQKTNAELQTTSDLVIGCDGAYSAVRQQMVKRPGFCFSQEYIEHGYKELCIPSKNGDFAMPPNFLHIWPRDSFMMIALPNQDKSFTVTLSMPFTFYSTLKSEQDLLDFFEKYYPDAIPLIGKQRLIDDFFQSGPQFLVSIKCKPYHLGSTALLLGDAAHAMVPYYGQGMNAGFEDCTILSAILNQKGIKLGDALQQYSKIRKDDAHAICDLAMYNYTEMRDLVTKKSFKFRKTFDEFLYRLFPKFWVPLYSSVSFSSMPYNQCIKNRKWQDKMLSRLTYGITLVTGISGAYFAYLNLNSS